MTIQKVLDNLGGLKEKLTKPEDKNVINDSVIIILEMQNHLNLPEKNINGNSWCEGQFNF